MSKHEALRRESEDTSPIDPNEQPTEKKHEALGQRAEERSDAVLDRLHRDSGECMRDRGADDMSAGYPGTVTTSGNESNVHNPDAPASDANPQP